MGQRKFKAAHTTRWMPSDGANGRSVIKTDVEYAQSASNQTAPTSGWSTVAPSYVQGYYIWTRTYVKYSDGDEYYTPAVCLPSGKGISSIEEEYYQSTSATLLIGGRWSTRAPIWVDGKYIWTRSHIFYTDGTDEYTSAINATGATGAPGQPGDPGSTGESNYTLILSNQHSVVNCDYNGTPIAGAIYETSLVQISYGSIDALDEFNLDFAATGIAYDYSNGVITPRAITANVASITVTATHKTKGNVRLEAVYTVSKNIPGSPGQTATSYTLIPAKTAIRKRNNGELVDTELTFKVKKTVGTAVTIYESLNEVISIGYICVGNSRISYISGRAKFTINTSTYFANADTVEFSLEVDGNIVDKQGVGSTYDGAPGQPGTSVTIEGRVDDWQDTAQDYSPVDGEVWAINSPFGLYWYDSDTETYRQEQVAAGKGYLVEARTTAGGAYEGHLLVSNGSRWIDAGAIKGTDGRQVYLHIAYCNKDSEGNIIDFTDDDEEGAGHDYMGTYSDYEESDAGADSPLWNWKRITGNDAMTIYLNSFYEPAKPTPANYQASGWSETPAAQDDIKISHGGSWTQTADGSYQSPPTKNNEAFEERFEILTTKPNQVLNISIASSSESSYDKGYIGALDTVNPQAAPIATVSGINTAPQQRKITIPTAGKHFIVVSYLKDVSQAAGEDCVWVKIGRMTTWMCKATGYDNDGNPTGFSDPIPITDTKAQGDTMTTRKNVLEQTRLKNAQRMGAFESSNGEIVDGIGECRAYHGINNGEAYLELLQQRIYQQGAINKIENNQWYTLSFWAKGSYVNTFIYPSAINTNTDLIVDGQVWATKPSDGYVRWTLDSKSWRRHTVTFKTKAAVSNSQEYADNIHVLFRLQPGDEATILMPKLEKGDQATTYQMNEVDIEGTQGKMMYPAGVYDEIVRYTSDEYCTPLVQRNTAQGGKRYYWLNAASSQGEDPASSAKWVLATFYQVVIAELFMANFGKIASAVFHGDFMFSQHGTRNNVKNSTEYQYFEPSDPDNENAENRFAPNTYINFLTGAMRLAAGKAKFNPDGSGFLAGGSVSWQDNAVTVTGTVNATAGQFGAMRLENGRFKSTNQDGRLEFGELGDSYTFITTDKNKLGSTANIYLMNYEGGYGLVTTSTGSAALYAIGRTILTGQVQQSSGTVSLGGNTTIGGTATLNGATAINANLNVKNGKFKVEDNQVVIEVGRMRITINDNGVYALNTDKDYGHYLFD